MLGFVMHRLVATLQVLVCCAYIRVSRLVSRYHNALGIGEVSKTTVFEAVELITVTPAETFTHQLIPLAPEHLAVASFI